MEESTLRKPYAQYKKRLWSKTRKPWEGELGGVEAVRNAMWKSIFHLSDERRYGFTVAEIEAASRIIMIESENHGAAELGFGNPYDQNRVKENSDRLYREWMDKKAPAL
jgi:hypothetical protein